MSRSRILILAKSGRLKGAHRVGKVWVFPADIEKPVDMRTTAGKANPDEGYFRFPLYLYNGYTEQQIETQLTRDERELYYAQKSFLNEDYSGAYLTLRRLSSEASQIPVRAGAMFYLCRTCIALHNHREYVETYEKLKTLVSGDIPYARELTLMMYELDTYTKGVKFYIDNYHLDMSTPYHISMHNYLVVITAFSRLMANLDGKLEYDTAPYELMCMRMEDEKNYYTAMKLHMYIGAMGIKCCHENSAAHLKRGLKLAVEHGGLMEISYFYHYIPMAIDDVLEDDDMKDARKIVGLCTEYYELMQEQIGYMNKKSTMLELNQKDLMYVYLARMGYSTKETADYLKRSVSTVSKHYSELYERTGAKNKKELVELCMESLKTYKDK